MIGDGRERTKQQQKTIVERSRKSAQKWQEFGLKIHYKSFANRVVSYISLILSFCVVFLFLFVDYRTTITNILPILMFDQHFCLHYISPHSFACTILAPVVYYCTWLPFSAWNAPLLIIIMWWKYELFHSLSLSFCFLPYLIWYSRSKTRPTA